MAASSYCKNSQDYFVHHYQRRSSSSSVKRLPWILCHIIYQFSILLSVYVYNSLAYSCSALRVFFTKSSYFLIVGLAFGRHFSSFQWTFEFLCHIFHFLLLSERNSLISATTWFWRPFSFWVIIKNSIRVSNIDAQAICQCCIDNTKAFSYARQKELREIQKKLVLHRKHIHVICIFSENKQHVDRRERSLKRRHFLILLI